MSVRETPDLRDGLTANERRVLDALSSTYARSDRVVGDDAVLYEALVRMAQPFSARYPLVEGLGNFGSVDVFAPADIVYTEARLTPLAADIERFPNVLVNGGGGIPPHNLAEVIAATRAYLDESTIAERDLIAHIPGPDFPSGGVLVEGPKAIGATYTTGRGTVTLRARVQIERLPDRAQIVLLELPQGVPKLEPNGLIHQVVGLVNSGAAPEIVDIFDRKEGGATHLVIALAEGVDPEPILERLYDRTQLQTSIPIHLCVVADGASHEGSVLDVIRSWVIARAREHSVKTIRRDLIAISERYGDERRTSITG